MRYKYMLAAVVLLSVFSLFGAVGAQSDALSIANLDVYPQPISAGSNITLSFELYNSYTNELTNVNLELVGTYPLLNYSPAGTDLITDIPEGLYGGYAPITYGLHIPSDIKSGTYTLSLLATYQTVSGSGAEESASSTMPISFYIRGAPSLKLTASPTSAISPGSQSAVNIDVLNVGTDNATNVSITLLDSRNFSIIGGSDFSLGTVMPQGAGFASAILLANSTLNQGTAELPVVVKYGTAYGSSAKYEQMVPISVSLGNPAINLGIVSASPESLYPGTNQTLSLSLQNVGSGTAKNVTISVTSDRNITVGNSASKILVGTIAAGSSAGASLLITANKNDNQSRYSIPISITYQNANYNLTLNKTVQVPITLQAIAQFNVTEASSGLAPGGTYVPITLRVRNSGNEVAQSITFSLQTIYPISQVNPNAYVGSLAPGQSTNVTFYVNVDSQANPGQYPLTLYEQWTQPTGSSSQQYSASQDYYAMVSGSGGSAGTIETVVAVIVVVVAAVAIYRRRAARKGAQKKEKK